MFQYICSICRSEQFSKQNTIVSKLFWSFIVRRNCSSDLKCFQIFWPSTLNCQKFFLITITNFFPNRSEQFSKQNTISYVLNCRIWSWNLCLGTLGLISPDPIFIQDQCRRWWIVKHNCNINYRLKLKLNSWSCGGSNWTQQLERSNESFFWIVSALCILWSCFQTFAKKAKR